MSIEEIKLPDVGGEEVEIIEISVSVGDKLEEDEAIIVVETEKASMDIPAPYNCTIESLNVKAGDKISEGMVIASVKKEGAEEATPEVKEEAAPVVEVEVTKVEEKSIIETNTSSAEITSVVEDVFVPDIGGEEAVDVIEILASIGDSILEEDGIITLETEKATMDVPAPFTGILKEILVQPGAKVKTGDLIARMQKDIVVETPKETVKKEEPKAEVIVEKTVAVATSSEPVKTTEKVYASPSVRKLAREFGVDLGKVSGTGNKNRILKEDVRLYIKAELTKVNSGASKNSGSGLGFDFPELKEIDYSKFGEVETVELSRIQKISGPSLHRNWVSMPHVTQFDEADITELESFRKEQNAVYVKTGADIKISPLVFAVKAVAKALELHPNFNSSLSSDGQSIIFKKYVNIAVAIDTPNGLVVPVIKDANKKGFEDIAKELKELSIKARDGKLKAADMQGGCFTISSLGGIGGTYFTPIINAPEVAILGLSKSEIKPVYNGSEFEPKLILPLSLSYDHRVIDGADGARFTTTLSKLLSNIRLLLL
ncbi:dihydrolipoamide acetyltransferase [Poseidonibacter parvus]|uniref:Dihydrolipoamide acetyltransferase component of pyruvate dehydrogenase complex n=1 Tax=Poseidonibacter parvus TaxID=1850254 RepID=A0A1P8KKK6_9BACT|nr:dihydrolipoyllysine-residue acetyltransferase [Poseidonibacter parvus]APW65046.1 dihydrolipoamide acetyltransferase [Poseidonibacter parvus]